MVHTSHRPVPERRRKNLKLTRSRFTGGQVRYVVFVLVVVSAGAVAGMWAAGFGGTSHTTHVDPWPRVDQSTQ